MKTRALFCVALCVAACTSRGGTERIFDGRVVMGRRVAPEAYAAFVRGSWLEATGRLDAAERAYREAARHDPESPAIATRLGVLACRADLERALAAFRTATAGDYAPALAEQALCLQRHGKTELALASARRAVAADPGNRQANLLIADHFERSGNLERARQWLLGWALFSPDVARPGHALSVRAKRLKDPALLALADPRGMDPDAAGEPPADVTAALLRGDLPTARLAAAALALGPLDLGWLASVLGRPELGVQQAELILAADPANAEALILGLQAAALMQDQALLRSLAARARAELPASSTHQRAFADLLRWYAGSEVARRWLEASRPAR